MRNEGNRFPMLDENPLNFQHWRHTSRRFTIIRHTGAYRHKQCWLGLHSRIGPRDLIYGWNGTNASRLPIELIFPIGNFCLAKLTGFKLSTNLICCLQIFFPSILLFFSLTNFDLFIYLNFEIYIFFFLN